MFGSVIDKIDDTIFHNDTIWCSNGGTKKNTDRQVDPKDASASKNNKCILPCDYGDL